MARGDHYKWRLMRQNGIDEKFITGNSSDYEKFEKFVECVQYAIGNPIYHWCHLELKRYFNVHEILCSENTRIIWDKCLKINYTPRQLIKMSNVHTICTTDDPTDSLEYHIKLKDFTTKILPTFRPDKLVNIDKQGFVQYIEKCNIKSLSDLEGFIEDRLKYFREIGCRISDHGLDYIPYELGNAEAVFDAALKGGKINSPN